MFEVVVCKDQLAIPYHHMKFDKSGRMTVDPQILCDLITHKYNDRIQLKIGLLIDLYDIVKVSEVKSIPDVKVAYATIVFRYIVFNPPIGSIWEGQITASNEEGILVALSFFKDILIPYPNLPEGSEFNDAINLWTWTSGPDVDENEAVTISFQTGKVVRFRVCEVRFQEDNPDQLMFVIGSMDSRTAGLGLKEWWVDATEDE